jgi:hypothetical protein
LSPLPSFGSGFSRFPRVSGIPSRYHFSSFRCVQGPQRWCPCVQGAGTKAGRCCLLAVECHLAHRRFSRQPVRHNQEIRWRSPTSVFECGNI